MLFNVRMSTADSELEAASPPPPPPRSQRPPCQTVGRASGQSGCVSGGHARRHAEPLRQRESQGRGLAGSLRGGSAEGRKPRQRAAAFRSRRLRAGLGQQRRQLPALRRSLLGSELLDVRGGGSLYLLRPLPRLGDQLLRL